MRISLIVFLVLYWVFITSLTFNNLNAEEKIFSCKPVQAAVQTSTGHTYHETLEDMDEEAGLLSAVPTSEFLLSNNEVFYKNNPSRDFEYLFTYEEMVNKYKFVEELETAFRLVDKELGVENVRVFYLMYNSFDENNNNLSSLKRISINKKNHFTSEITVPSNDDKIELYYFLRKCDGQKDSIQVDFEPGFNKALS
tara:strand:- start:1772 stop:2359 length:588 start_codon:yes stop_codon:yes gene_type:complete